MFILRCAASTRTRTASWAAFAAYPSLEHDEVKSFGTTTSAPLELNAWRAAQGVTHVARAATGVFWKPVWHLLEEDFDLVLPTRSTSAMFPGEDAT